MSNTILKQIFFSVTVWYCDEYYYYATVIVVMALASVIVNVYLVHKQERNIRDMVHSSEPVHVIRNATETVISSEHLVPGVASNVIGVFKIVSAS